MGATEDAPRAGPPAALTGYTGYLLRRAFVRARASGVRVMPPGRDANEHTCYSDSGKRIGYHRPRCSGFDLETNRPLNSTN